MNRDSSTDHAHDAHAGHGTAEAGGLAVSAHGYTLELDASIYTSGRQTVNFRIIGPNGQVVRAFTPSHEKEVHFIAVRRDTTEFQHVHPVMDLEGTWSVELDLTPADWRLFADFQPAGHEETLTLGIDVAVAGHYSPQALPEVGRSAHVDDYTVTLQGQLLRGQASDLTLTVSKHGAPVTDLEPYLAAYGHLVALRVGDLGYLHVHPEGDPSDATTPAGPEIVFMAAAPSPGFYRLYLDFQHEGTVRTAEFTVHTSEVTHQASHYEHESADHSSHGHQHH